jgi:type II secretory pathway pseudopilin PulG
MIKSLKIKKGFTLVETIVALAIIMVVVLSVMSAVVFSLKFNTMEKAKTLAQDVSRNVMSQQVRTVKFETLLAKYNSTSANCADYHTCPNGAITLGDSKSITLFSKLANVNNLTTSSLSEDLSKLSNAKCEMNIKKLSDTQLDIKIRVMWDLKNDGTMGTASKSLELSTLVSNGDLNLKRSDVLAIPSATIAKTISCDGTNGTSICAIGYHCETGVCVVNPPQTCTCAVGDSTCVTGQNGNCPSGQSCDTGDGTCKVSTTGCSADADCGTGKVCLSGICKASCTTLTCATGFTWDATLCQCTENLRCSASILCVSSKICSSGLCITPCTSTSCALGTVCNSTTKVCDPVSYNCSPTCGKNYTCVPGIPATCVNSCTLNFNRPSNCACTISSQCKSLNCKTSGHKCE